jgi:hypothetical protein
MATCVKPQIVRRTITALLGTLIATLSLSHVAHASGAGDTQKSYDIIVAGAGTGGISTAVQAARLGSSVALLEETDWIGGQAAAAGVGNMDEGYGPDAISESGFYAEFVAKIGAFYKAHGKSVGTCYYGNYSHCYDPSEIRAIFTEMIADVNSGKTNQTHGHIDLYLQDRVVQVLSNGNTVTGVVTSQHQTLESKILIDATEYGDVIPLTPARYRMGRSIGQDQMHSCTQATTWTAVIKKYPQGVPPELVMHTPPPEYEKYAAKFRSGLRVDGNTVTHDAPVSFAMHNAYRGFPDLSNPQDYTGAESAMITRMSINMFNDYAIGTDIYDRDKRKQIICQAKLKTLANIYYIQYELGEKLWSIANDEGYDTEFNRTMNNCPEIPAEFKAIEANFPPSPYIRESIRIVGEYTITGGDIRREKDWGKSFNSFTDSIAVGEYADDLHGCKAGPDLETELEHGTDYPGFRFGPFQVPLRSLIPEKVDGLLVAEKNLSQSRLVNGATRLHPITMMTGEAVGTLAALAIKDHVQPRHVSVDEVQAALLQSGAILVREKMSDLTIGSLTWKAAQFTTVHKWIWLGDNSTFQPQKQLTRRDGAHILANAFLGKASDRPDYANTEDYYSFDVHPGKATYSDVPLYNPDSKAVEAIHEAGVAPACSDSAELFCPNQPLKVSDFLHAVIVLSANEYGSSTDEHALRKGISAGDSDTITRAEAAIILYNSSLLRFAQLSTDTNHP